MAIRKRFTIRGKRNVWYFTWVNGFRNCPHPWWYYTNQNWGLIICFGPLRLDRFESYEKKR